MKALMTGAAAIVLLAGVATAQTVAPGTGTSGTATTPTAPAVTRPAPTTPQASDRATAGGDSNQAVATTGANAVAPAHGANSFTEGQARSRIESNGFTAVSNLAKDDDGVWRGQASKDGRQMQVWLDYKGNVGLKQ
jgi:hypothetical protein